MQDTELVSLDLGNLAVFDRKLISSQEIKENFSEYILKSARDDIQILIDKIFQLPLATASSNVGAIISLPKPTTILPREKPIPTPRPPTKWEIFAKEKGIKKKRKRDRLVHDRHGELRPRWGRQGIHRAAAEEDWVIEDDKISNGKKPFKKVSKRRKS